MAMSEIGMALRHYRAERSMSQVALAALLGINQSQVSRWERGLDLPRFGKMQRIRHLIRDDAPSVHRSLSRFVEGSASRLVLFNENFEIVALSRPVKAAGLGAMLVEGLLHSPDAGKASLVARTRAILRQPGGSSGVRIGVTLAHSPPLRLEINLAICAARNGLLAIGELDTRAEPGELARPPVFDVLD
jgi:transcriptional regulator with XRE-family HTH domain